MIASKYHITHISIMKRNVTYAVADPDGGATGAPPPPFHFDQLYFVFSSVSECFKISLR